MSEEKKDRRKGNSFWKQRSRHGRELIFSTSDMLWKEAIKYFKWCDKNPIGESMRAYTLQGLCYFLRIGMSTWLTYKKRAEYKEIVEQIEMVIYNQKFTGAAANIFNANIISRDLGLIDKREHAVEAKKQEDLSALTDQELIQYYELQKKIQDGQQPITRVIPAQTIPIHNRGEWEESRDAGEGPTDANR